MDNEKTAFLSSLLPLAGGLAGSMAGATMLEKILAPKLISGAKSALKRGKKPASFVGRQKKNLLKWTAKKNNAEMLSQQLGMIPGGAIGGTAGAIASIPFASEDEINYNNGDMQKYSQARFTGFLKAANQAGLSGESTLKLVKRAFNDYELRPEDIARVRQALEEQGVPAPYSDPYGPLNSNYNENILKARDNSFNQIPEVEGSMAAARKGITGGALGGLGGYTLGSLLKSPNVLGSKIPYTFKSKLPGGLGALGLISGALMGAIPAYKQKIDEVEGLQKLNYPENMQNLINNIQLDKQLLAS